MITPANQRFRRAGASPLKRGQRLTFLFFSLPGTLLYSLFFIYPVILGMFYSVTDWNGISRVKSYVGFQNYYDIFTSYTRFAKAISFNAKYAIILLVCVVTLAMALALLLNCKVRGITFFRAMFFLPAVLCGITISLVFEQVFYRVFPLFGQALGIPWLSTNVLGDRTLAMYGIMFVHVWQGVAMPTVLLLAGLQTIPEDLYEAATIDGAGKVQCFRYITLPFLIPVLAVVSILVLKGGMGVFDYIKGLTDGGPANSTMSLSILIYEDAFTKNRFGMSTAEAIVVSIILLTISMVQLTLSNRKKVEL